MPEHEVLSILKENLTEENLWAALALFEGCPICTVKGLTFCYTIRGGELFVDRKEKSITKATVELAFRRVIEMKGIVRGPKKLGVFGASYLYPIFIKLGIIHEVFQEEASGRTEKC